MRLQKIGKSQGNEKWIPRPKTGFLWGAMGSFAVGAHHPQVALDQPGETDSYRPTGASLYFLFRREKRCLTNSSTDWEALPFLTAYLRRLQLLFQ